MAFDGITVNALVDELNQKLENGRIEKVYQPEKDELYINIRNNKVNYTLLLSANANNPRAYLTEYSKLNPKTAPTFCMLLRKNLTRGKIISIKQPSMERIIEMEVSSTNELGDLTVKMLIIEIMGRHSNIILINKENYKIIDSIKRIGSNISRYRQVLPGNDYIYPPNQNKYNPLNTDGKQFDLLLNGYAKSKRVDKFFVDTFTGISPLISREVCYIGGVDRQQTLDLLSEEQRKHLKLSFLKILEIVKNNNFTPNIIYNEKQTALIDFSVIPLKQYHPLPAINYNSVSNLLEQFYQEKDQLERLKQKNSNLLHSLKNKLDRSHKKLIKLQDEFKKSEDASIFRLYGELLTSNIYNLRKGMNNTILYNFYSTTKEEIEIPLNPNLTPVENAQKYFKKYNKSKNAILQLSKQISSTKDEIYYLESQMENLKNCTELQEIEEIKTELRLEGYLSALKKTKKSTSKNPPPSSPLHFISSDGSDIYVGKNNKQNDTLTLKSSSNDDMWLHTKGIPGSHVIIKNNPSIEITDKTLLEGAILASYYSKARNSNNVPVDYTKIKYVKKAKGAKPGMVIYDHFQTLFVTPNEDIIFTLKRIK